jgi:pyrroloquinoline quinone biosynthesis protein D
MTIAGRERPARREGVWVRRSGEENALLDPTSSSVHLLNETALAIWELCDGQTDPEEMIVAIVELSGLNRAAVAEDVERILSEFGDAGLVIWAPRP